MKKSKDKKEENRLFRAQTDRREDDPYYNLAVSKENWRRAFFISAFALVLMTVAFIALSFQRKVQPWLVSVEDFDQVTVLGPAEKLNANHERLVRAELYKWIRNMRMINGDREFMKNQLREGFSMVSSDVSSRLNKYYSEKGNDPIALTKDRRRSIEVSQILQTDEEGNWRIQWVETTMSTRGGNKETTQWEAFIKVENYPPTETTTILKNPLGLYVTELNWGAISPTTLNEDKL